MISPLLAEEVRHLYGKRQVFPRTSYEAFLMEHTRESLQKAFAKESKLQDLSLPFSPLVIHHLLNNLCSLVCMSYLHNGLGDGETFLSALYGNTDLLSEKLGITMTDQDFHKPECDRACGNRFKPGAYEILPIDFNRPLSRNSFDIYFYDNFGPLNSTFQIFTYLNQNFSPVFIMVIDDWNWEGIRRETFKAFDTLGYEILFEQEIANGPTLGNGQYIAVIKQSESLLTSVSEDQSGINK